MSESLFAIALDLLIRWAIARRMLVSSRFLAYPDDLAAVLNSYRQMPIIIRSLQRWAFVAGLKLKPRKCVQIPLWDGDADHTWGFLEIEGIGVASHARYLGVEVGRGAAEVQWDAFASKLKELARDIATAGATLPTRV